MSHLQLVPTEGPLAETARSLLAAGLTVSSVGSTGTIDYLGAMAKEGQRVGMSILRWSDTGDRQVVIDIPNEANDNELAAMFAVLTQAIRGAS